VGLICAQEFAVTKPSWIRKLFTRPVMRTLRKAPRRRRPLLEALEERSVPARITPTVNPLLGPAGSHVEFRQANFNLNDSIAQADILFGLPVSDPGVKAQAFDDGAFTPPPPLTGDSVPLDVIPFGSDGRPQALVANQKTGLVSIQAPASGGTHYATVESLTHDPSLHLAPGAVQWAQLEGPSGLFDAVVVASGSNSVLVYHTLSVDPVTGTPTFAAPVSSGVGTDPVAVTIQDINGDGVPDMLVANKGSNDVSVIFGSIVAGRWVGTAGPRLKSGGDGPVATMLRDTNGDGISDLVVTNGQSGSFAILTGRGQGFFDDRNPQVLNLLGNPTIQAPSMLGSSERGVVVTGGGQLLSFNLDNFDNSIHSLFGAGGVRAAQALADGEVMLALRDGAVVELNPATGAVQRFQSLTGIPSDPSALDVLQGESGLQVLVTSAGEDQIFVFGVPGVSVASVVPPPEVPSSPTVEVTPPDEGSLTLVVTLVAGPLPGDEGAVAAVPQGAAAANGLVAGGGAANPDQLDQGTAAPGDGPARPGEGVIDVPEKLRSLDLAEPDHDDSHHDDPMPRRPEQVGDAGLARGLSPAVGVEVTWTVFRTEIPPVNKALPPLPVVAVRPDVKRVTDAVFARPPEAWDRERLGLMVLGLMGLSWLPRRQGHVEQSNEGSAWVQRRQKE
jgi:hypothetical protein